MAEAVMQSLETGIRAVAFGIICRRDGLAGWKTARDEFLAGLKKNPQVLQSEAEAKLRSILAHAYETVPYYRETWKAAGIDPARFRQPADLRHFPTVSKEIVRSRKAALVSDLYDKTKLDLEYTGGTTGTQTSFYRDHDCTVSRAGRQWGILSLCGYRPGMKRALVWGAHADLTGEQHRRNLRTWFREFARAQETIACSVMTDADMHAYHRRLRAFRPAVMYGYPNAMEQFGQFVRKNRLEPIRVKSIIATAERLTEQQRQFFREVYGGEVFNLYCTREYGCVGFECSRHNGFHIDTGSVVVEITRNGKPVPPGEVGEITITDLLNRGMPLIRSRTGDRGSLALEPCDCGSPLPLLKSLDGRVTDMLYRPDGAVVAGVMLVDLFWDMNAVRAVQFVQNSLRELEVLLVVGEGYSKPVEGEVLRQVRELMGADMRIRLVQVPEIPRNPRSGKYQEVICRVSEEEIRNNLGSGS